VSGWAVLLRGPGEEAGRDGAVHLQVTGRDQGRVEKVLDEVHRLAIELNVYRGQVISFGAEVFGPASRRLLGFLDRPRIDRAEVILPPDLLDGIERQVLGIDRHAAQLQASGQHLKRGVLLHGPPGTGKTHTVRYLLGKMPGVTAIVISGAALRYISEACSIARALQPSVVVAEDVDLIAGQRGPQPGQPSALLQLLSEMDGLGTDANVTFLLTTNRPDLLEEALAARPGRVDHTARLPLPDAAAVIRPVLPRLRPTR
jgi:cell division protease FtsH